MDVSPNVLRSDALKYFVAQVEAGSTNVRVGSTIFGARQYPPSQSNAAASEPTTTNPSDTPLPAGSGGDSTTQCIAKDIPDAAAAKLDNLSLSSWWL